MSGHQLPGGETFTEEFIKREFRRFSVPAPSELGTSSLSLLLPDTWRPRQITDEADRPNPKRAVRLIAQFNGPATKSVTPFAQIEYATLLREISAENWLRFYCAQMDYVPQQIDRISSHVADALVGLSIDNQVVAARVAVRFFDARAFVVVAGVSASEYELQKDFLGFIVRGFVLRGERPGGTIEVHRRTEVTIDLRFLLPVSWSAKRISGPDTSKGAFDLISRGKDGKLLGQMRFRWLDRSVTTTDTAEREKILQEFALAHVKVGAEIRVAEGERKAGKFGLVAESVNSATVEGAAAEFEFWLVLLRSSGYRVFIGLVTPSRKDAFYWWAVNRRALEIVASSLS